MRETVALNERQFDVGWSDLMFGDGCRFEVKKLPRASSLPGFKGELRSFVSCFILIRFEQKTRGMG